MRLLTCIFLVSAISYASGVVLTPAERDAKLQVIRSKQKLIGPCFFKNNDKFKGKIEITISWQIDDKGVASNYSFKPKKPGAEKLFECFKESLSGTTFESAPKGQHFEIVDYPLSIFAN